MPVIGAVDFYGEHEFMTAYAVDLTNNHALGLVYRPGLYRLGADAGFCYEHVISVEIAWKMGLF